MNLERIPALHVVEEATNYQAAFFFLEVSSEETCKSVLTKYSRTHLGPPNHLRMDQRSILNGKGV